MVCHWSSMVDRLRRAFDVGRGSRDYNGPPPPVPFPQSYYWYGPPPGHKTATILAVPGPYGLTNLAWTRPGDEEMKAHISPISRRQSLSPFEHDALGLSFLVSGNRTQR